jgi:NADPH-dependent F420 reductase
LDRRTIALIGGTGPEGRGLGLRWALAGHQILIGSRDVERAVEAAGQLQDACPEASIQSMTNKEAASRGDLAIVTIPYGSLGPTLTDLRSELAGKIVVSVVAPLVFSKDEVSSVQVAAGSAALECQALLPNSVVVAAFHTISAQDLLTLEHMIDCDVVVCGNDLDAKQQVMDLAKQISGVRPLDGSSLACARYIEDLTALILNLNRNYRGHAMVKFVGI